MIRVVYEDPHEISDITSKLSDKTIESFYDCTNLKIMAVTRCTSMTGDSFAKLLYKRQLNTLDLHKDPNDPIGELNEGIAETILSSLVNPNYDSKLGISKLNLFGQNSLSSEFLYSCLIRGFFSCIKSLSLNHTLVDEKFLCRIFQFCPNLEYLSIKKCSLISSTCVESFLRNIPSNSNFKKIYALESCQCVQNQYLELDDSWFGEQRLDISSLW